MCLASDVFCRAWGGRAAGKAAVAYAALLPVFLAACPKTGSVSSTHLSFLLLSAAAAQIIGVPAALTISVVSLRAPAPNNTLYFVVLLSHIRARIDRYQPRLTIRDKPSRSFTRSMGFTRYILLGFLPLPLRAVVRTARSMKGGEGHLLSPSWGWSPPGRSSRRSYFNGRDRARRNHWKICCFTAPVNFTRELLYYFWLCDKLNQITPQGGYCRPFCGPILLPPSWGRLSPRTKLTGKKGISAGIRSPVKALFFSQEIFSPLLWMCQAGYIGSGHFPCAFCLLFSHAA